MDYKEIFNKLWLDYSKLNPGVTKIHQLLEKEGETIVNDHIAFRTFDLPGIDIESIASIFILAGYVEKGRYFFEDKRLNAKHYEHFNNKMAPKVFISELITGDFTKNILNAASATAAAVKKNNLKGLDLLFAKNVWEPLSYTVFQTLREESEYAAWMYAFGFRANHFTVFVNSLKKFTTLEKLNAFLKVNGFLLNQAGGEIKGSEADLLKQSSTLADNVEIEFVEGIKKIPCCYYEFAERFLDNKGVLFNGFIEKSADKIFESTNLR
jgi:hypothetical protein